MNTVISEYLKKVKTAIETKQATEHSFRGHLETMIKDIVEDKAIGIINEPKRIACGAPDYIIHKNGIPIGYIEAKDVGWDLAKTEKSEQMKRYLESIGENIILTDYLEFRFFRNGERVKIINLAEIEKDKLKPVSAAAEDFIRMMQEFTAYQGRTITSSEKLAKMMAKKARMMEEVIFNAVNDEEDEYNSLKDQLKAFRQILIHDLDEKTFADIYAQTIAYGMFAARLHDKTPDNFSRQEARELIPKTNPFLRSLFDYISGAELDERIVWIVDDLVDVFRATDLQVLLKDFGKMTAQTDPFLHFYETFLTEYDPKLRMSRGVFYTPEPVVKFIVRAVDDILKTEFNIPLGLASTDKIKVKRVEEGTAVSKGKNKGADIIKEVEVHKVQILDPATGTGTFLAEVVKHIHGTFKGQEGMWSNYVEEHLIPRINGFEILMASYTVCHLKLEMLLQETGYVPKNDGKIQRLRVFLTNSLEEPHPDSGTLFASWLSREATEANKVKNDTPVMVVMGNPPYAVSSTNKGEWIQNLIADYKRDLNEKKINLDDDYIKFIRYGQHFIDKNGSGVLAYISNNSFIDGITHRQMRKSLLESFDKIYILDLHGNAKKKETALDGSKDENVFDIMQGVSINIFIKTCQNRKEKLAEVNHYELYGRREEKYIFLKQNNLNSFKWNRLYYKEPYNFFVPIDYKSQSTYTSGFSIVDLFQNYNSGIQTKNDGLTIQLNKPELENIVKEFKETTEDVLKSKYNLTDTSGWTVKNAKTDLIQNEGNYYKIYYRPFDIRHIYMTKKSGGFVGRPRIDTMKHFLRGNNYGLISVRQQSTFDFQHILISNTIMESGAISLQTKEWGYIFPLYLYPEDGELAAQRTPNLNMDIVNQIASALNLTFTTEKVEDGGTFAPIDILDYIYAVLHSPNYREKYKEFLKIDFPRVPYPEDIGRFWDLVTFGRELRQIHLLEHPVVNQLITSYPVNGSNTVEKIEYKDGKVWINPTQYFDKVPEVSWEFYIGGYQPAQKWLKDRKGRTLGFEDILHYQKVIVALNETARIMGEIDEKL